MAKLKDVKAKPVSITLNDGIERHIKFTLNALAELEDRYGSVEEAFKVLEEKNSIKALRCILWAGFLHESPDLTEFEVGNLIDIEYLQDLTGTLGEALSQDMPTADQVNDVQGTTEGESDPNE